jgi:hypothetical protein
VTTAFKLTPIAALAACGAFSPLDVPTQGQPQQDLPAWKPADTIRDRLAPELEIADYRIRPLRAGAGRVARSGRGVGHDIP